MQFKLNIGAGEVDLPGYIPVDRKIGCEAYPLKIPRDSVPDGTVADECVDEVRASHILEHFGHGQVMDVLREWVRVLKPGGVLKVAVPNFEWIAKNYLEGKDINVQGYVMGGHDDANDHHGTIFDPDLLTDALRAVGLVDIKPWTSDLPDCAALPVSLNLQGTKPARQVIAKAPAKAPKVACCMSVPRLGFQDNFFCWAQALLPLGIRPTKYDGAFWGQCLERVMEEAVDADYILTVDYDSLFTKENVAELIRLMDAHPEVDALAPVQVKRGDFKPLITVKDESGKMLDRLPIEVFDKPLLRVNTAHFGLTLIRASKLRTMPHPWFLGIPNAEGRWGEGRVDDDIYFWQKWNELGNAVYQANRVVIGHGVFMGIWPGQQFEPLYQNPSEFWKSGPPKGVWR